MTNSLAFHKKHGQFIDPTNISIENICTISLFLLKDFLFVLSLLKLYRFVLFCYYKAFDNRTRPQFSLRLESKSEIGDEIASVVCFIRLRIVPPYASFTILMS